MLTTGSAAAFAHRAAYAYMMAVANALEAGASAETAIAAGRAAIRAVSLARPSP